MTRLLLAALVMLSSMALISSTPVYVMLQLDLVTSDNKVKDPNALKSQLATLKNSGVDGVMCDVWWGLVESAPQKYDWSAYTEVLSIVRDAGLKFQGVMSFHECGGNVGDACNIPLPSWATQDKDIFYQDREGNKNYEYISLFADSKPVLQGRTPVQVYADYVESFLSTFSGFEDTIVELQISMGPAGELRYPSYPLSRWSFPGVGEFQCYDKHALESLANAATAAGHSEWGHGGPGNAGNYNSQWQSASFFTEGGNDNYSSDYGRFFLTWYSSSLISHGARILGAVRDVVDKSGLKVGLAGKISGIHWLYNTPSHAAELTAGYYNIYGTNGYDPIAKMFAKYGVAVDFTCLEMQDNEQPSECACAPAELVLQVKQSAINAGVGFSGENALPRYDQTAFNQIIKQSAALGHNAEAFTYLRLGQDLLNNMGTFQNFVNGMHGLHTEAATMLTQLLREPSATALYNYVMSFLH
eukprot:GFYU01014361.1.p1 GENE.GFYU01014361.1~~GFYU01014361.1.p1  ORF type:complete len:471 (-),score=141.00 GFYU01014361.1:75-1487(-)